VLAKAHALGVPADHVVERVLRAAERDGHVTRPDGEAAGSQEVPLAVADAVQLIGHDHDPADGRRKREQVAHCRALRRVHMHVPLRRPLGEAAVDPGHVGRRVEGRIGEASFT